MSLKFFDKLSQNLIDLLNDKDDHNVIIEVENKEKSFTAHSNILKFRSTYFRRELENIQPNENNIKMIIKSSISTKIFNVILQYIYGGIVDLENCETRFIYNLMLAADGFELEELTNKLEILLIETKGSWLRTHFSFIYHSIFSRNDFKKLKNFCNDIVVNDTYHPFSSPVTLVTFVLPQYPNLIFDSSDFTSLEESAIVSLLKRDDLQIEEIKIWDYVIKWGIARNPGLPTDLDEWTKEDFLTLKTTLQQCLPHILYFQLSNIEIYDNIKPYKKILDEQLWEDINQHIALPDPVKSVILPPRTTLITELPHRTKEPFSTIISEEHAAEISAWIDRKTSNYLTTNIPYNFQLILLGTRDGFAPQTFWDICNGHSNTVVVARVKGTDEIIGGYNPLEWDNSNINDKWIVTKDSFIFSLKNGDIQNSILSRVKDPENAITNVCKDDQNRYGPYFDDLWMYSDESDFTLDNKWDNSNINDKWIVTKDSFIFSLKNGDIQNSILSRVKDPENAITNVCKDDQNRYGPYFDDLWMYSDESDFTLDNSCRSVFCYYEKPIRSSEHFSIINYEVFKIVRKTI
ncbi:hypothetical protein Glove_91g144 [Diversispora epigaea]|uniref:BTB domain-containing protein n=1 Tax=Diversispora epigaea TaxID=1348612 RepID=A0A397JF05_9GLOM|nr:hypothetical protein Glove_91g144 [Diversispora epigaea]